MGWTPDGSQLLFASDRGGTVGLWAQPFSRRRPQGAARLVRADIGGTWSLGMTRDGSLYFGVRKNDRDISVTTVDLQTGKQLTSPVRPIRRFVGTNVMPDWSSDGKYLAYVSQRGFNPTNNNGRIIGIRDMATGEERELHPSFCIFGPIKWSPDGKALLTAGTDIKGRSGVFINRRSNGRCIAGGLGNGRCLPAVVTRREARVYTGKLGNSTTTRSSNAIWPRGRSERFFAEISQSSASRRMGGPLWPPLGRRPRGATGAVVQIDIASGEVRRPAARRAVRSLCIIYRSAVDSRWSSCAGAQTIARRTVACPDDRRRHLANWR